MLWEPTPIDRFFAYDAFHVAAESRRRTVPFADSSISILAAEHLMVCKVIFNRPKDWVDIGAMLELGTGVDAAEVFRWVGRIAVTMIRASNASWPSSPTPSAEAERTGLAALGPPSVPFGTVEGWHIGDAETFEVDVGGRLLVTVY